MFILCCTMLGFATEVYETTGTQTLKESGIARLESIHGKYVLAKIVLEKKRIIHHLNFLFCVLSFRTTIHFLCLKLLLQYLISDKN